MKRSTLACSRPYPLIALRTVLTLAEPPSRREYSPEEAQQLLAGIAERLAEVKALLEDIRDGLPHSPDEDRMLEAEIPIDLATELRGMIGCSVDDDLTPTIERLRGAATLTAADLLLEFDRRRRERAEDKRVFAAIAPRVVEILDGKPPRRRSDN